MGKNALITGATDGIGKATAIELAKKGYNLHILGRNKVKGMKVLEELNIISPKGKHELFITDLSNMAEVNEFLETYQAAYSTLDVLILNAGIYPSKIELSEDGIDQSFSIGYISRYLFSVKLNDLLNLSAIGKVIHINGSIVGSIKYSEVRAPKYSKIRSVWQNSVASALLVRFWKEYTKSTVHHIHWNPGIVNTQTVKSQGSNVRFLSRLMGMIEPEQAGKILANHVDSNRPGQFYFKGKAQKMKNKILRGEKLFNDLVGFSEAFTCVKIPDGY
jgi:NAD(P)-dependent dehydrogenase (short-subunit alcohol dehydrogenase family)